MNFILKYAIKMRRIYQSRPRILQNIDGLNNECGKCYGQMNVLKNDAMNLSVMPHDHKFMCPFTWTMKK